MNQDSSENITDDIIEVASTFKSKYGSISLFTCGLVPRDYNLHLIEYINEANHILKNVISRVLLLFVQTDMDSFK